MTFPTRRTLLTAAATLPAALSPRKPWAAPKDLPPLRFTLADGTVQTLADYIGKGVVLNLWATWCAPCVEEMPALAALARQVRGDTVAVLPLSSDRGGAAVVERFYRDRKIEDLPVMLDPRSDVAHALGVRGIPTTLLIDSTGKERARVEGGADWGSADSVKMVRALRG